MSAKPGNLVVTVLVGGAIVAALYFGREVLLPIALAVLLSFVLAPPVRLLQRLYLPRLAAITIVVLLAFGVIFGLATLMFAQVSQLAADLPSYQSTLRDKIQALRGATTASGTLEQASEVLQNLQRELDRPKSAHPASPVAPAAGGAPHALVCERRKPSRVNQRRRRPGSGGWKIFLPCRSPRTAERLSFAKHDIFWIRFCFNFNWLERQPRTEAN
jgi:hypothetical protein